MAENLITFYVNVCIHVAYIVVRNVEGPFVKRSYLKYGSYVSEKIHKSLENVLSQVHKKVVFKHQY